MLSKKLHVGHALILALALLCGFLGWRAFSVATAPLNMPPPFSMPPMADRALLAKVDPFFPGTPADSAALPVTALPFSLHGVRADSASGRGSAFIASGDGAQNVYLVGETVADGVTLVAIAADHVVLDRGGTREALWLDAGGNAPVQTFTPEGQPPESDTRPADDLPANQPEQPPEPDATTDRGAAMMAAAPARED